MAGRMLMFVVSAALLAAAPVAAEIPPDLQQAIRERDEAVAKKDAATWDRLTTADFTVVFPDGRLMKKAERLAQLKGQKPEVPTKPQQEQFTRYGDTVIRRTQEGDALWIEVWVKDGQAWRVAAAQGTAGTK